MPQVLVRNENTHPYREKFQDRMIEIPPGETVQMDADEAKRFLSKCNGVMRDADGQPDPRGFKRLRIESLTGGDAPEPKAKTVYVSHIDGKEFGSKKELDAHLEQFKDKVVTDENAEREIASRKAPRARNAKPGAA